MAWVFSSMAMTTVGESATLRPEAATGARSQCNRSMSRPWNRSRKGSEANAVTATAAPNAITKSRKRAINGAARRRMAIDQKRKRRDSNAASRSARGDTRKVVERSPAMRR